MQDYTIPHQGGRLALKKVDGRLAPDPSPNDMNTPTEINISEIVAAFNAAEALITEDESVLCDILSNASPTDYGADDKWTAKSLQKLFEEELGIMEESKEYDENAADFLSRYDAVKHLPIDWENVCTVLASIL